MPDKTIVLYFGDVSGPLGRKGVKEMLPVWKEKFSPDIIIANVENLAHNKGVTIKTMEEISSTGVEMFSGGNHIWKKYNLENLAEETDYKIAAPANDNRCPKKYLYQTTDINGTPLTLINLSGRVFMEKGDELEHPFQKIDELLKQIPENSNTILDMHAEVTSEKRAIGFYLDGRVSAVLGTHTHVPTADVQILPKGTGYITDIGMIGPYDSVLGIKKDIIVEKFLTDSKIMHDVPTTGQIEINAVLLEIDNNTHKTTKIEHLRKILN